jgi:hypothetical protein
MTFIAETPLNQSIRPGIEVASPSNEIPLLSGTHHPFGVFAGG